MQQRSICRRKSDSFSLHFNILSKRSNSNFIIAAAAAIATTTLMLSIAFVNGRCVYEGSSIAADTKWTENDCTICYCPPLPATATSNNNSDVALQHVHCTALGECEAFTSPHFDEVFDASRWRTRQRGGASAAATNRGPVAAALKRAGKNGSRVKPTSSSSSSLLDSMQGDQADVDEDFFATHSEGGGSGITATREYYRSVEDGQEVILDTNDFIPTVSNRNQDIAYRVTQPLREHEGRLINIQKPNEIVKVFSLEDIRQSRIKYIAPEERSLPEPISASGKTVFFKFEARDTSIPESRGDLPPEQSFYFRIISRNQRPPEWLNTEKIIYLEVKEGDRVRIPPKELQIQDPDTPLDELEFYMTDAPEYGQLVRIVQTGDQVIIANRTKLLYPEFRDAVLMYDHAGGSIKPDELLLTASDGKHQAAITVRIKIIPLDREPPRLDGGSKIVSMYEGEQREVTSPEHITYIDNDSGPEQITMHIKEITDQGDFITFDPVSSIEKVLKPGDSFTQQDVDEGKLLFRAPDEIGKEQYTDHIVYDVVDKEGNKLPDEKLTVIVYPIDDEKPVVTVIPPTPRVPEGDCIEIPPATISITDVDTPANELNFVIERPPTFGHLEHINRPGVPVTTFSVEDFDKGLIRYCNTEHEGIEPEADQFLFKVTDPKQASDTVQYNITITPVNDEKPSLFTHPLRVPEGGTKPMTNDTLQARDDDNTPDQLSYILTDLPAHGKILGPDDQPIPLNKPFTHRDVIDKRIKYAHDGSEPPTDEIRVELTDGTYRVPGIVQVIIEPEDDEAPQLIVNEPTRVERGGMVPIDSTHLVAEDADSPHEDIKYTLIADCPIGRLVIADPRGTDQMTELRSTNPEATNHFFQRDVNVGRLRFIHNLTTLPENSCSFSFRLSDPQGNTNPSDYKHVIYVLQDRFPPRIIVNRRLPVKEGGSEVITPEFLRSTDRDSPDEWLLYTIVNPNEPVFGHIEFADKPGVPIRQWRQGDIDKNRIVYNHTSEKEAMEDSFLFTVSDGVYEDRGRFLISIAPIDDQLPKVREQTLTLRQGERQPITEQYLIARDADTQPIDLIFYVTNQTRHGRLLLRGRQGQLSDARSFSMQDIFDGNLFYQHDNTKTQTDQFYFRLRDGSGSNVFIMIRDDGREEQVTEPQPFDIVILPEINRPPLLLVNLPLQYLSRPPEAPETGEPQGIITPRELRAKDPDTPDRELIYRITKPPRHGRVELTTAPGRPIIEFTQEDLNNNLVRYVLSDVDTPETSDDFTFQLQDNADPPNVLTEDKFFIYWSWINFREPEYTVQENAGVVRLLIEKTGNTRIYSFVECSTQDGTASGVEDYQAEIPGERISFEEGATQKMCTVPIRDDRVYEGPEYFMALLSRPLYALLRDPKRARVTITDEEDSGCIEFTDPVYYVKETIKVARIPVVRTGDLNEPASVLCYTRPNTAKGTDDPYKSHKADFVTRDESKQSRIVFRPGQSKAFCDVQIIDDGLPEDEEDFFLILGKPSDNTRLCTTSRARVVIHGPNDAASVQFAHPQYVYREADTTLQIEVVRSGSDLTQAVEVLCSAGETEPPSARVGEDFQATQQSVRFAPGQISAFCNVRVLDDNVYERNETFRLVLTQPIGASLGYPSTTFVTLLDNDSQHPRVQFAEDKVVVNEQQEIVEVPVVRTGNLQHESFVRCHTMSRTAVAGLDFVERPDSDISELYFAPGEKQKMCPVRIIDDKIFEPDETFLLVLSHAKNADIGLQDKATVVITNAEDYPQVFFAPTTYSVNEPHQKGVTGQVCLTVRRNGDLQQTSQVRVSTRDGTALAGQDYVGKTELITFMPGEASKQVCIEILKDYVQEGHEKFSVILGPDQPINAHFGLDTEATVTIVDYYVQQPQMVVQQREPGNPMVISLLYYNDIERGQREKAPPGYPLICVTPCDRRHPQYNSFAAICPPADSLRYRWEMAIDVDSQNNRIYHTIVDDTPFTNTHSRTLDPIYFGPNTVMRCGVDYRASVQFRYSADIVIASAGICHRPRTPETKGTEETWRATIEYISPAGAAGGRFANTIHISVHIPHRDGILPIVSTFPIHNIKLLLSDGQYRSQHVCSNLLLNKPSGGSSGLNFLEALKPAMTDGRYGAALDTSLRADSTVSLYQHLDLERCLWQFDAYYDINTLVDQCGGTVHTHSKDGQYGQRFITVTVPLYISYIYAVPPNNWGSIDHRTTLDVEIGYDMSLWHEQGVQQEMNQDQNIDASLQITRLRQLENGSLEISFRTQAKFRGIFVLQQGNEKSQVLPPRHLPITFNLQIAWQQDTYERPAQIWLATSDRRVQDYTGDYIIALVPCVSVLNDVYDKFSASPSCQPKAAKRFNVPISFQESPRPEPANFFLNTEFRLDNDASVFADQRQPFADAPPPLSLSSPGKSYKQQKFVSPTPKLDDATAAASKSVFNKGDTVHGCVMWNPLQDLSGGAFSLQIQRLYLCAGKEGFVPLYDPTGERYKKGPQLGCIAPSQNIKHAFLLLSRENPKDAKAQIHGKPFQAHFLDAQPKFKSLVSSKPGIDGFTFQTDPLYSLDQSKWYIQVIYLITVDGDKHASRVRRSAFMEFSSQHMQRSRREAGSNIRSMYLANANGSTPGAVIVDDADMFDHLNAPPSYSSGDNNRRSRVPFGLSSLFSKDADQSTRRYRNSSRDGDDTSAAEQFGEYLQSLFTGAVGNNGQHGVLVAIIAGLILAALIGAIVIALIMRGRGGGDDRRRHTPTIDRRSSYTSAQYAMNRRPSQQPTAAAAFMPLLPQASSSAAAKPLLSKQQPTPSSSFNTGGGFISYANGKHHAPTALPPAALPLLPLGGSSASSSSPPQSSSSSKRIYNGARYIPVQHQQQASSGGGRSNGFPRF